MTLLSGFSGLLDDLATQQTFGDYLAQVRQAVLTAQEHQDVPFEQVVEAHRYMDQCPCGGRVVLDMAQH